MGQRVRRRQDDHRAARPTHSSLSYRRDRQRVVSLSTQQYRSQAAHQGTGTNAARQDAVRERDLSNPIHSPLLRSPIAQRATIIHSRPLNGRPSIPGQYSIGTGGQYSVGANTPLSAILYFALRGFALRIVVAVSGMG